MYSVEYKWTKDETPETTISITVDNESKQKLQLITSNSEANQGVKKISQFELNITVSKKAKSDNKKDKKIAVVDNIQAPLIPINRPKHIQEIKLKNGKIKIQKYINVKFSLENLLN